jgi:hypothetical protein
MSFRTFAVDIKLDFTVNMRQCSLLSALFFASLCAHAANPLPRAPEQLARLIEEKGARAVIDQAWSSGFWDRVILPGVESGTVAWLRVASLLRMEVDAGSAETLSWALVEALPKNPYRVLPVMMQDKHNGWTADQACFINPDVAEPKGGLNNYLQRLDRALYLPKSQELKALRAGCLSGIARTREAVQESLSTRDGETQQHVPADSPEAVRRWTKR